MAGEEREDKEGEKVESDTLGDEDCVEEAGGEDVGVGVGHGALCRVGRSMRGERSLVRTKPSGRFEQRAIL